MINKKMTKNILQLWTIVLGIFIFSTTFSQAAETSPQTNQGNKWRVGYLEVGNKPNYVVNLKGLLEGLMDLGWVKHTSIPTKKDSSKTDYIWEWLSDDIKSDYIEFVRDAYWSSDDGEQLRAENKIAVIERLNKQKDIDFMIVMGTKAGQDMGNDSPHSTNTMIMDASNPLRSKIISSKERSGKAHLHAKVEPDRYRDQIRLFQRIFEFKKLGIVYISNPDGRSFSAIDDIKDLANELHFSLVECPLQANIAQENIVQQVIQCHEQLAPQIDAMYITSHLIGTEENDMKNIEPFMRPMLKNKIPTWSQAGGLEVEHGVLMSFDRPEYADLGIFQAEVMAQILRGTPPGEINQVFQNPKTESILLNMETARRIEFNPGWDVIAAATHIYINRKKSSYTGGE